MAPPAKKPRLLDGSSSEDSSLEGERGVSLSNGTSKKTDAGFQINANYAMRFEHNKKREELHRLQEKHGRSAGLGRSKTRLQEHTESSGAEDSSAASSSYSEEDDDGELATEVLDEEISATLRAIRSKDFRVYDQKTTFYTPFEGEDHLQIHKEKTQKPMYLRDYHRENLLNGASGKSDESEVPRTFAQEQDDLRRDVINEIKNAGLRLDDRSEGEDSSGDETFLVAKEPIARTKPDQRSSMIDVDSADKDPETFLSNFMASRAWVPTATSRFQAFESDDEEEDRRAEEFEDAYNLRFEDPKRANEKLLSHAREAASKYSVRREEPNRRRKLREAENAKRERAKQEHQEERARLRKLEIEELESKLRKIKKAAGIRCADIKDEDWAKFLEDGWDDAEWEKEMVKRFDSAYYAENDYGDGEDEQELDPHKKRKLRKPTWEDDIDIKDLMPDFQEEEPNFSLSDNTGDEDGLNVVDGTDRGRRDSSKTAKKQRTEEHQGHKKEARRERKKIEQIVDQHLDIDSTLLRSSSKGQGLFRYRDTSPLSYGLTANDILLADDSQLNQFAGLKKLATFRDVEKKRKDQKHLGKKARLRKWRKETFGNEDGPKPSLDECWKSQGSVKAAASETRYGVDIQDGKKKRKRSKKIKPNEIQSRS